MTKNIKKIILYILLSLAFILFLLFYQYTEFPMLTKAYYLNNNNSNYGSSLKINKDDYYDINLLYINGTYELPNGLNVTIVDNHKITIKGTATNYGGLAFNLPITLKDNTKYTAVVYNQVGTIDKDLYFWDYTNNVGTMNLTMRVINNRSTFISRSNNGTMRLSMYFNNNDNIDISFNFMLYEGDYIENLSYSKPYRFGYNVINNNSNDYTITFTDTYDNSKKYVLNKNSSIYLPFQYLSNCEVTFNYIINYSSSSVYDNQEIIFIPIFSGTRKDNNSNTLLSDYNYTYNYMYINNLTLSTLSNTAVGDFVKLEFYTIPKDNKQLTITNVTDNNIIITDFTNNILQTNYIDDYNYFNSNNSIYSFKLYTYVFTKNYPYIIGFDSINLGIKNSQAISGLPVSGSSSYEHYNTCSAWYDIPCQLGNGFTYVLYNVPVISPLISLLKNMVDVIYNIITMIKWYEGLGILFSLFIFILLIRILIMLLKGSNDDRGKA